MLRVQALLRHYTSAHKGLSSTKLCFKHFSDATRGYFSSKQIPLYSTEIKNNVKDATIFIFTVKILKFGTPQTIAIIVLKIEKFNVTLHQCIQKMLMEWQTA